MGASCDPVVFTPAIPLLKRHFGQTPPPAGQSPPPNGRAEPLRMFVNGAYYPNWSIYKQRPPSSLQLNLISHVYYAFAFVKPNGTVFLSDEWADTQMEVDGVHGCLRAFQQLKTHHQHLKFILSVGGAGKGSENFAAVASDPQCRQRFAHSARELCITYGLDGIDIDWEHPSNTQQGQDYILLLDSLRRYLPAPYIVTSALPCGEWALQHIALPIAAQYLDFINLMSYDFAGPWTDSSGHHAQLYTPRCPHNDSATTSCDSAISYVRSMGVPAYKIILGIPAYGRSFLGCDDVGQQYTGHAGDDGTFEYRDLPRPGASEHVDMALGAAYCCGSDGGFVSYDNAQTVRQKAAYVKEQGLGGVFYWTATADRKGSRSLVEASFSALHT
ncbi:glycoside hydrolase superfamily [Trichophaea hybrida]|nr:glycoside hydrolase superfamily [Trichophaea hybrida]